MFYRPLSFLRRRESSTSIVLASILCLGLGLGPGATFAQADNIRPFTTQTLDELKQELDGRGFILSLWSVTCAPCRQDLEIIAELRAQHPELPLILVSTDAFTDKAEAAWVLENYGLADMTTWMFADSFAEPLRYSIDPQWYGELPRSYFFDSGHIPHAHSGVLQRELLLQRLEMMGYR